MQRIIECVPNFSEGRDTSVIDQIATAIEQVDGVALLDVDPGRATHRTVVTFAGEPQAVVDAAVAAAKVGTELIDMRGIRASTHGLAPSTFARWCQYRGSPWRRLSSWRESWARGWPTR